MSVTCAVCGLALTEPPTVFVNVLIGAASSVPSLMKPAHQACVPSPLYASPPSPADAEPVQVAVDDQEALATGKLPPLPGSHGINAHLGDTPRYTGADMKAYAEWCISLERRRVATPVAAQADNTALPSEQERSAPVSFEDWSGHLQKELYRDSERVGESDLLGGCLKGFRLLRKMLAMAKMPAGVVVTEAWIVEIESAIRQGYVVTPADALAVLKELCDVQSAPYQELGGAYFNAYIRRMATAWAEARRVIAATSSEGGEG